MKKIKIKRDALKINRILEEATLVNIIQNPSFETNEGWINDVKGSWTYASPGYIGERCLKFEQSTTETRIIRTPNFDIMLNHKYYARHYVKTDGPVTCADCRFEIFAGDGDGLNWVFAWNHGNFPNWTMQSNIVTIHRKAAASYYFRTFCVRPSGNFYTDGVMLIDLTAAFGAGAEPSKAWCDKHIPFFEGTCSIALPTTIGEYKISTGQFIEQSNLPVAMRIKDGQILVKEIYEGEDADMDLRINNFTVPRLNVEKAMAPIQLTSNQSGVTWSLVLGELPPGVTFSSSGVISGTPQRPGTFYALFGCQKNERIVTKGVTIVSGDKICRVTFNAGGGTCSESFRDVPKYTLLGTLPTPKLSGQEFGGWFTASTGGLPVDGQYTVIDDITLYARYGQSSNVEFGPATTQFNIQYMGDRTNFGNAPYTLYGFRKGQTSLASDLVFQTGIQSANGNSNNITNANRWVKLYLKVTNNGDAGYFSVGFDCDSYIVGDGNDAVSLYRLSNGVRLGTSLTVTVTYPHTAWIGKYNIRQSNRLNNIATGNSVTGIDSGYAFTINDVFINSHSYTILEVTYQKY